MEPTGAFWQVGRPPLDDLLPMLDMQLQSVVPSAPSAPNVAGALRRWGRPAPSFSVAEQTRNIAAARDETAALKELVSDMVSGNPRWNSPPFSTLLTPAQRAQHAAKTDDFIVPNFLNRWKSTGALCDLAARATKGLEIETPDLIAAATCYRGKFFSKDQMLALDPAERIGLVCVESETAPDWYYEPDSESIGYTLPDDAYGVRHGIDDMWEEACSSVKATNAAMSSLVEQIRDLRVVERMITEQGLPTVAHVTAHVTKALNEPSPYFSRAAADGRLVTLRRFTLARYKAMRRARWLLAKIEADSAAHFAARREHPTSRLLDAFTTADLFKPVVDTLEARDAARFLRVLRGTKQADEAVVAHLRTRMPHLHIFATLPLKPRDAVFPHATTADGRGKVYADRRLGVCIALCTTELRTAVAARYHGSAPPIVTVSAEETIAGLSTYRANAALHVRERAIKLREQYEQAVASGKNFGFADGEEYLCCRDHTADGRRLAGNGWSVRKHVPNDEMLRTVVNPTFCFKGGRIKFELVNAATGEVVDAIEKQRKRVSMRALANASGCERVPSSCALHSAPRGYGGARGPSKVAFVSLKLRPGALSSNYSGARFKVRCVGTFTDGRDRETTLTTQSAEFVLYSNSRVQSAVIGRKRKDGERK